MRLQKSDVNGTPNIAFILSMTASDGSEALYYVETVKRRLDKADPKNWRNVMAMDLLCARQALRDMVNESAGKA